MNPALQEPSVPEDEHTPIIGRPEHPAERLQGAVDRREGVTDELPLLAELHPEVVDHHLPDTVERREREADDERPRKHLAAVVETLAPLAAADRKEDAGAARPGEGHELSEHRG
ncbi:hypothetical protein DSECCO2_551130 [anaerobic digester metagenome]